MQTLARAVFARCEILLLDGSFSGLDGQTESTIFDHLFAPNGLIRQLKTSTVLVTNSCNSFLPLVLLIQNDSFVAQFFEFADHIVILGDDGIVEAQGDWQTLKVKPVSVTKIFVNYAAENNAQLAPHFDNLSAQLRAKDEIGVDLTRRSGDFTLYSEPPLLSAIHSIILIQVQDTIPVSSIG